MDKSDNVMMCVIILYVMTSALAFSVSYQDRQINKRVDVLVQALEQQAVINDNLIAALSAINNKQQTISSNNN